MKISVIMPVYNCEEYLARAVTSVFAGGVSDIELIAVEDCSSDNSRELLRSLSLSEPRIKPIFNEENLGVGAVRNLALSAAMGEYVAFCDSDDTVPEGVYSDMLSEIGDADLLIGAFLDVSDSGNERYTGVARADRKSVFTAIFSGSSLWHKLYKREFLVKNSLTFEEDMKIGEDVVFLSRLAVCEPTYSITDRVLYRYYHHDKASSASLTHRYTADKLSEHIKCRRRMLEICSAKFPECRDYVYNHFVEYLDRFIPFVDGAEERAAAFSLYREFMSEYDWQQYPEDFLAITGIPYESFKDMNAYSYLQAKYDVLPRDRVYWEARTGKIGLRWIMRYFIGWCRYKLFRKK